MRKRRWPLRSVQTARPRFVDLGCGDAGYIYLMTDVLLRPIEDRGNLEVNCEKLNSGNFIAFAAANRWLRSVVYIPNPRSHDDLMYYHFKNFTYGPLQLKGCDRKGLEAIAHNHEYPIALEPEVPFKRIPADEFQDLEVFSFAALCQSPGFTPEASDRLIPVIMEYIQPI